MEESCEEVAKDVQKELITRGKEKEDLHDEYEEAYDFLSSHPAKLLTICSRESRTNARCLSCPIQIPPCPSNCLSQHC